MRIIEERGCITVLQCDFALFVFVLIAGNNSKYSTQKCPLGYNELIMSVRPNGRH
jgi:hypothetical protein